MINDYPEEIRWARASMVGAYRIRPPKRPDRGERSSDSRVPVGRMRYAPTIPHPITINHYPLIIPPLGPYTSLREASMRRKMKRRMVKPHSEEPP